ncbi:MAG: NAD-dependent deacetylase, partial [Gammaproteobacteria bacterium]|nr:NAD-dependent deacetylase [Gammaproteobacteria bacterium]
RRFQQWLAGVDSVGDQLVVVEIGAGTSLPSIRRLSERIAGHFGAPLIRINPRESQCGLTKSVSLPMAGLEALTQLI